MYDEVWNPAGIIICMYNTSNKKHFNEMNSYVGTTMIKKEQGQGDYFNQQSILLTLPTYISPLIMSSTFLGW